jgi:cytochrome b6-f complex iron-sulfur subunit
MSTPAILVIAVVALAVLAIGFLVTTARKTDRNAAVGLLARETVKRDRNRARAAVAPGTDLAATDDSFLPAPRTAREVERAANGGVVVAERAPAIPRPAMDAEQLGVARRQFLNRGIIAMFILGLGSFPGLGVIAFLWPKLSGGFGSKVNVGKKADIFAAIEAKKEPFYNAEARSYIVEYPKEALSKARQAYAGGVLTGMEAGVAAIYQKCVHLGCKVPWCGSSQWFECPCHGSQYNRIGEKKGGPAPRGLDHFAVSVSEDGSIIVDSGSLTGGPPIGTNTTGQEAEGPHCVSGAEEH